LVVPQAEDGEAMREAAVVFWQGIQVARVPNFEKPGGSFILVSRGEEVALRRPEFEGFPGKLSKQRWPNQRILNNSELVEPPNPGASEFFVEMNPWTLTVAIIGTDVSSACFQKVWGIVWRNGDKKMTSTTR
jgi:hypothetical protein